MKIRPILKIIPLGISLLFWGCGNQEKPKQIYQKTNEALGETNNSGCDGDEAKEDEECSEDSPSNFILNALEEKNPSKQKDDSLRGQLDTLLEDMSNEEKTDKHVIKNDLESLVNQVGELLEKDSNKVAKGLESLVDSYDKDADSKSIRDELENLVEGVESSKLKREVVESRLLALVGEVENKKIKREEVEEKLLALVGDASKGKKQSLKQTQLSLESLVSNAEKKGTKEAKRLASSIIEDVSQNKIKILKDEDTFVIIQVQEGDSLSALAAKYYGDSAKYTIIHEANQDKIGNKNTIYPGITLVIPKLQN